MTLLDALSALRDNPDNDLTVLQLINCLESLGLFQAKTDKQVVDMVYQLCRECGCGPGIIGKGWIRFSNKWRVGA